MEKETTMSKINIYNGDARKALENSGCPACGEPLKNYEPGSEDLVAVYTFECGCELTDTPEGYLEVQRNCPDATQSAIERRVIYHDAAEDEAVA